VLRIAAASASGQNFDLALSSTRHALRHALVLDDHSVNQRCEKRMGLSRYSFLISPVMRHKISVLQEVAMSRYALSLPQQLKQKAEELARQQGVSLNQFILWAVAE
jgi:hypothetical protein